MSSLDIAWLRDRRFGELSKRVVIIAPNRLRHHEQGGDVKLGTLEGERPALDHVVHCFGDIGRMVAHPFYVLRAEQEMNTGYRSRRIFEQAGEQLLRQRGAVGIDFLILFPYFERPRHIPPAETVQRHGKPSQHQCCHAADAADRPAGRKRDVENDSPFGDVLGQVADPFEVIGRPQDGNDIAGVDGHRLTSGNGDHRLVFDRALERIHIGIAGDHVAG